LPWERFFWPDGRRNRQGGRKKSREEEKIGKAEDFSGLFFLPPCLGNDFSGLGKEIFGKEKERNPYVFKENSWGQAMCLPVFQSLVGGEKGNHMGCPYGSCGGHDVGGCSSAGLFEKTNQGHFSRSHP